MPMSALMMPSSRVDDDGIGNDEIEAAVGLLPFGGLTHTVADGLSAAKDHLIPIGRIVFLDLRHETGIGQVDLVALVGPYWAAYPGV